MVQQTMLNLFLKRPQIQIANCEIMHQSFVSTAPPPKGMGGDSDFHFSEPWYKPHPVGII